MSEFEITCDECGKLINIHGYRIGNSIDLFCTEKCALKNTKNIMRLISIQEFIKDRPAVEWQIQKYNERIRKQVQKVNKK